MFAAVSLALLLASQDATPKQDLDTRPLALAQVLEQALLDFELRYSELGLLGSAPLAGMERVALPSDEVPAKRAAFDGAAQAAASH